MIAPFIHRLEKNSDKCGEINCLGHMSFPQRYLSQRYCACSRVMALSFISAMLIEPYSNG